LLVKALTNSLSIIVVMKIRNKAGCLEEDQVNFELAIKIEFWIDHTYFWNNHKLASSFRCLLFFDLIIFYQCSHANDTQDILLQVESHVNTILEYLPRRVSYLFEKNKALILTYF